MRQSCLLACALVIWSSDARPNTPQTCAAENDAGKRLLCYDAIFRSSSSSAVDTASKWLTHREKSKIDDTETVVISIESEEPSSEGLEGTYSRLWIRCQERQLDIFASFAGQFMSDHEQYGEVTYRVDNNPAFTTKWLSSTDHSVLGIWESGKALEFIEKLLGASRLVLRAVPYNESVITAEFNISGIRTNIEPVFGACRR